MAECTWFPEVARPVLSSDLAAAALYLIRDLNYGMDFASRVASWIVLFSTFNVMFPALVTRLTRWIWLKYYIKHAFFILSPFFFLILIWRPCIFFLIYLMNSCIFLPNDVVVQWASVVAGFCAITIVYVTTCCRDKVMNFLMDFPFPNWSGTRLACYNAYDARTGTISTYCVRTGDVCSDVHDPGDPCRSCGCWPCKCVMHCPECERWPCKCQKSCQSCGNFPCTCRKICTLCGTCPCMCRRVCTSCGTCPCTCRRVCSSCGVCPCTCQHLCNSCGTRPCSCRFCNSCGKRPCTCPGHCNNNACVPRPFVCQPWCNACGKWPCICSRCCDSCGKHPCCCRRSCNTCGTWPCRCWGLCRGCGTHPCACAFRNCKFCRASPCNCDKACTSCQMWPCTCTGYCDACAEWPCVCRPGCRSCGYRPCRCCISCRCLPCQCQSPGLVCTTNVDPCTGNMTTMCEHQHPCWNDTCAAFNSRKGQGKKSQNKQSHQVCSTDPRTGNTTCVVTSTNARNGTQARHAGMEPGHGCDNNVGDGCRSGGHVGPHGVTPCDPCAPPQPIRCYPLPPRTFFSCGLPLLPPHFPITISPDLPPHAWPCDDSTDCSRCPQPTPHHAAHNDISTMTSGSILRCYKCGFQNCQCSKVLACGKCGFQNCQCSKILACGKCGYIKCQCSLTPPGEKKLMCSVCLRHLQDCHCPTKTPCSACGLLGCQCEKSFGRCVRCFKSVCQCDKGKHSCRRCGRSTCNCDDESLRWRPSVASPTSPDAISDDDLSKLSYTGSQHNHSQNRRKTNYS